MSLTDINASLTENNLHQQCKLYSRGNSLTQQWEHFFTSYEQTNLYKALVDASESDKIILDTYGKNVTLKRRRDDDEDKDEEPSTGPDRGSKRRREGKEPESASAPSETATKSAGMSTIGSRSRQASSSESTLAEEPVQTTSSMEEPSHLELDTGADDQLIVQSSQHPDWFSEQQKPPTLNRAWNKTLPAIYGSIQPWISELAKQADTRFSFNELLDTHLDFSNFLMNRLRVDTLTPELLAGPTYELMKGSCKILIELEYHLEDVYKATTDQLDWVNPEDLKCKEAYIAYSNPRGFIYQNKDKKNRLMRIDELCKFSDRMLIDVRTALDDRLKGIRMRIKAVTELKIVEWHRYKHLDWITVRQDDDKLYKVKEGIHLPEQGQEEQVDEDR
nr:hypothetical protein [Tanacetum cinerariifolium]